MELSSWVFILGIVFLNVCLLVVVCLLVFKKKEADEEIEKEIFNSAKEENENAKNMNEIYKAMEKASAKPASKVESFEQEQEENAIISFNELLKFKEEQEKLMAQEERKVVKEEPKKFSNTEVISPVFGRMEEIEETDEIDKIDELEKNLNVVPLRKEIKESEEFLNALKEFRKNL